MKTKVEQIIEDLQNEIVARVKAKEYSAGVPSRGIFTINGVGFYINQYSVGVFFALPDGMQRDLYDECANGDIETQIKECMEKLAKLKEIKAQKSHE